MTDTILQEASKQYKTPFYLFDIDELIQNVDRIKELAGEDINICYAMKANPFLVAALADQVNRIEACSVGEYDICRNQGIKPEKIILSGVLKKKEELERIFRKEMTLPVVTAESKEQFLMISELAQKYEKNIRILLRLTSGNQFGMELNMVEELTIDSLENPYLKIAGLHYFSGTQKTDVSLMTHELLYLNGIYKEFKNRYGIELEEMEYGPGVFVEYFQKQKEWEVEAAFQKLRMCAKNMSFQGTLTLELGRSLTATCGYYVTTIQELKKNGNASYAIVDGGIHQMHYDGQIMGMKLPFYRQLPRKSCEGAYWNVCGALCTVNDVLAKNMWLNEVQRGDVIVFEKMGAYSITEGMALFLSRELPRILVFRKTAGLIQFRPSLLTSLFHKPFLEGEIIDGRINENITGVGTGCKLQGGASTY